MNSIPPTPFWGRLLLWVLPKEKSSGLLVEELNLEYAVKRDQQGLTQASQWYRRQTVKIILHSFRDWLAGDRWGRGIGPAKGQRLANLARDIRMAGRSIRKSPAHSIAVIATLGIAIGANTAVFNAVNALFLRPLPYPAPEELVMVNRFSPGTGNGDVSNLSLLDFVDLSARSESFAQWGAYRTSRETHLTSRGAEEVQGAEMTSGAWQALGVTPMLGTLPDEVEGATGTGHAVVLSHSFWTREFGADSSVLGSVVDFQDRSLMVSGVMPENFYFPTPEPEFWAPISGSYLENRSAWFLETVGRLAAGVTIEAAEVELDRIVAALDVETGQDTEDSELIVRSRLDAYVGESSTLLGLLAGAVGFVLAIACANIANLSITKSSSRMREFALRKALGAGYGRLFSQALVESLVLATLGGALALGIGYGITEILVSTGLSDLPRREEITMDWRVVLFTVGLTVFSGIAFGLVPAMRNARAPSADYLRESSGTGSNKDRMKLLNGLAALQVVLAIVLTSAAGLLLNSFLRLASVEPGFVAENTLTMRMRVEGDSYREPEQIDQFHTAMYERLKAVPGIVHAAFTNVVPQGPNSLSATYYDLALGLTQEYSADLEVVDGEYFTALGIRVQTGRQFDETDLPDDPMKVLVSQTLADRHWGRGNAIGQTLSIDSELRLENNLTVIGVVNDVKKSNLEYDPTGIVYFDRAQFRRRHGFVSGRVGHLVLKVEGDPVALTASVTAALREVAPRIIIADVKTLNERLGLTVAEPRFRAWIVASFSAIALLLSLIGIYGVLNFSVAQRLRELAIRNALGATSNQLLSNVMFRGMAVVGIGIFVGLSIALFGGRALSSVLYGIAPNDPMTLSAVSLAFALAALASCYFPARRAARIDPQAVLRDQ